VMETVELDSLTEVDSADWNGLVGERSFYLTHQWLAAQDAGQPVSARYHLALGQGKPLGALPTYLVEQESHDGYRPDGRADGRWQGRYLLAGSRRAYANDLLVASDLQVEQRRQVSRHLLDSAFRRAEGSGCDGVLFLYLGTRAAQAIREVDGGTPLLTGAQAVIDLPGGCFDDYLDGFASKRRREIRREMARFSAIGGTVEVARARDRWEELAELFGNLQQRYGQGGTRQGWRAIVQRQAQRLDDHALIFLCRVRGVVTGALLSYPWRGKLYLKLAGFDYSNASSSFEYFNLVYYHPIRYAYGHGLSTVHLGPEALEAKLRRGARLAPLWSLELKGGGSSSDEIRDFAFNEAEARRWRAAYPWCPQAFGESGWLRWGCGPHERGSG
jgi:predicted N-acyltransferase